MGIQSEVKSGILRLEYPRPHRPRANPPVMYEQVVDILADAESDPSVRVILLDGSSCDPATGNDLQCFPGDIANPEDTRPFQFLRRVCRLSKPIVAAVNGRTVGVHIATLLHCDLVYAGESATFQLPFSQSIRLRNTVSNTGLPHSDDRLIATDTLTLGRPFGASQAHEMGLVSRVICDDEVSGHALLQATRLTALPIASLRTARALTKRILAARVEREIREAAMDRRTPLPDALQPSQTQAKSSINSGYGHGIVI